MQTDDKGLGWLYRRVLLRQILEVFRFTFTKSWDAQPTRFELPTGGSETVYAAREIREGRKLTNEELIAAFGGDVTVGSERRGPLNLPPDTSVVAAHTAATSSLAFRNRFVHVEIIIADREIASGAGPFRELCRLPFSESDPTRRPRYLVSLSAKFAQFRAGHPDMPLYRHWVDIMIGEVQRFDSVARWQLMRDRYLLLYAHRTKTPAQEMIEYTLKKAEEKK